MRKTLALAAAALLSLVAATGCSSGGGDSALRLGWSPSATAPQVAIAADRGLWSEDGLDVRTSTFTSGREALEALLGGALDAAVLTEFPLATAALQNAPVTAVATLSTYGSYRIIGSRKQGITDLASLQGKKIATTTGTNMHFITGEALDSAGVSAEIVNVGPTDIVAAVSRGDVDAGVMFDSFYPAAETALGDDYVEIPVPPSLYTGHMLLVVSHTALTDRRDEVQKLVNGLVDAATIAEAEPAEGQATLLTSIGGSLSPAQLARMWANYDYTPRLDDELTTLLVREADWIQNNQNVGRGVTADTAFFETYVDATLLDEARARR